MKKIIELVKEEYNIKNKEEKVYNIVTKIALQLL